MFITRLDEMPRIGDIFDMVTNMERGHEDIPMTRDVFRKFAVPTAYSPEGFVSCGRQFGFPADFVASIYRGDEKTRVGADPMLAHDILMNRFNAVAASKDGVPTARLWNGLCYGVVSPSYNECDDPEVFGPVMECDILKDLAVSRYSVTPCYTTVQMVFPEPFKVPGDDSALYWGINISNSMTGLASVIFNLYVWRQVCSNGLCIPARNARFVRRVHRGTKDIAAELYENIQFLAARKDDITRELITAADADARILAMKEENRIPFLARQLSVGEKEVQRILDLFNDTYGGRTQWGFAQAISEYARDLPNLQKRDALERRALLVA